MSPSPPDESRPPHRRPGSLRGRFRLAATGLVALVLAGNGALVLRMEAREVRESLVRESLTFARLAGPQVLRAFGEHFRGEAEDPELQRRVGEVMRSLPALEALALLGPRGRPLLVHPTGTRLPAVAEDVLARGGRQGFRPVNGGEVLEIVLPAQAVAGPPVWLQLLVSDAPVRSRAAALRRAYAGSLALLLALAAGLASRMAHRILRPLESLKAAALAVRDGDLSMRAPEAGGEELSEVARAFNAMAGQLEAGRLELVARHAALEKAYGELQALQGELVESERLAAVGRLAAGVSHEVDNPIGVILGTAEMLRAELADRPGAADDLRLIEAECLRCRRIVRDLLDLARPATSTSARADAREVAEAVLRALSHHPEFRGVKVTTAWAPGLPRVQADPDRLKQVLLNLLLNAGQAMGGKGAVTVTGEQTEGRVRLVLADEGPGIAREDLERVFEPFFTTRAGTGLGLAVSRRLVEEQGGRLWARRRPEGGSAFVLELLAASPDPGGTDAG